MPRDARQILAETEERLLREHGYRGTFYLSPIRQVLRLDWASSWGSDTRVSDAALSAAVAALVAEGYHATTIPGLPWARVMPVAVDLVDADAPKGAADAVREEPLPETERECELCEPMAAE